MKHSYEPQVEVTEEITREEAVLEILKQVGVEKETNLKTQVAVLSKDPNKGMVPCRYRPEQLKKFMKAPNRETVPETVRMDSIRIVRDGDITSEGENLPILEFASVVRNAWGHATKNTFQIALEKREQSFDDLDEEIIF